VKRSDVFARDAFTCTYCGRTHPEVELSVDHVEPRMRGGDNSPGNLVTACVACNRAKAGRAAWDYLSTRDEERARFLERATHVWPRLRAAIVEAARKP
jgi:5-methylcytosine-specific restriction endonuclease McrA